MRFGEKLKNARVGQGMTQETVAKQIGVSRQSLSNWEKDWYLPDSLPGRRICIGSALCAIMQK